MNPAEIIRNLQARMDDARGKLDSLRVRGSAGGDLVTVEINGAMEVLCTHIDPVAVDPRDVKMLEELVSAAYTDAAGKMRQKLQTEMSQIANLPPFPGSA